MDEQQQVFKRYKSSSQKQMPKKKTINTNGIICLRQNSKIPFSKKVPIQYGEHKKKWQKEFEIGISFISFTYDHSCR